MKKLRFMTILDNLTRQNILRLSSVPYRLLPILIMLLVYLASLAGYGLASASIENLKNDSISRQLKQSELLLSVSLRSYARLQWGNAGRIESQRDIAQTGFTELNEKVWRNFLENYDIKKEYPGMEVFGIMYGNLPRENKVTYDFSSSDNVHVPNGENLATKNEQISVTMERAARTGKTTISPALPSLYAVNRQENNDHRDFLMFTAFYDPTKQQDTIESRQQSLRGYSFGLLRGDLFFGPFFKQNTDLDHTKIKVYIGDKQKDNIVYEGGNNTQKKTKKVQQNIQEFGQKFIVEYSYDTAHILPWSTTYFPLFLLLGGLLFGILFATMSGYMLRSRFHRLAYEKERDIEIAKDELLSLASHQLRTPATGVKQYLGMVLQGFAGEVTAKQREYIERAYASNNRQIGIINDILHLAKLETGRVVLAEKKFNLAKMLREVIDEQRDAANKGQLTMELEVPTKSMVVGDEHMLRMVIENLITNAIKYTDPHGLVRIRLSQQTKHWTLAVADTGVGIAKSDFKKLFRQFTRINNPRSEYVTGSGVGLYLAYHLTLLHGGTITVKSKKGKGTTFTVKLPKKTQKL